MGRLIPLTVLSSFALMCVAFAAEEPIRVIYDTDMGNDVDDALALAELHAMQSRGACRLLAVTITKDHPLAAPFVDALNTFYGRGGIPIGVTHSGITPKPGRYLKMVEQMDAGKKRYPYNLEEGGGLFDAVPLLRKTLAAQPDGSVVVIQVGFSTNLAALRESGPDDYSPLDGCALAQRKISFMSAMAGCFQPIPDRPHHLEFNVRLDIPAAKKLARDWPTPIVYSGWEIGAAVRYPASTIERDYAYAKPHIIAEAYKLHNPDMRDQPLYDLTSVLYAVYPDRGYFDLSAPGRVIVEDDGFTKFEPQPGGLHRYLLINELQIARVQEALGQLCSQPPNK